jgi:hypothetical protein
MRRRTRTPKERSLTADSSSRSVLDSRSFESRPLLNSRIFDGNRHDHDACTAPRVTRSISAALIADSLGYKSA